MCAWLQRSVKAYRMATCEVCRCCRASIVVVCAAVPSHTCSLLRVWHTQDIRKHHIECLPSFRPSGYSTAMGSAFFLRQLVATRCLKHRFPNFTCRESLDCGPHISPVGQVVRECSRAKRSKDRRMWGTFVVRAEGFRNWAARHRRPY